MRKTEKFLITIQISILMTAVAFPVQAAINIGAPKPLSGSVVSLRSSVPGTIQINPNPIPIPVPVPAPAPAPGTQTTVSTPATTYIQNPTPAQSQSVNVGQPNSNNGRNIISLKNILSQPTSIPVTVTPTTTSPATTTTTPTTPTLPVIPSVTALTADEQLMVDMINQERIVAGLNPVKLDLRLASVGRAKANDLKANNYFDHTSPIYGSPWAMMQQGGLTVGWAGENISGNKSVAGSMAALMLSPGHRANILDPRFTYVGVGIAYGSAYGNLYVQEFLQE